MSKKEVPNETTIKALNEYPEMVNNPDKYKRYGSGKELIDSIMKEKCPINNEVIQGFWNYIKKNDRDIYNEFSLQHELGIYLRNKLEKENSDYKVEFERNVSHFNISDTVKKEIDIVIYKPDMSEKYAIELKFPRKKAYPKRMYQFVEDIQFMEEMKSSGFDATFVMTAVCDKNFYSPTGREEKPIYGLFRSKAIISGLMKNPCKANKAASSFDSGRESNDKIPPEFFIKGSYVAEWRRSNIKVGDEDLVFYFLEMNPNN